MPRELPAWPTRPIRTPHRGDTTPEEWVVYAVPGTPPSEAVYVDGERVMTAFVEIEEDPS